MAVTHPTAIRNDIADLIVDKIDVGGAGTIVFETSGNAEIATLTFNTTAFDAAGTASAGVATAASITPDTDCNAGTVSQFKVVSGGGDTIFTGSVTATGNGGDIILSSVAIGAGDTISISALTYEAPN
jgi:hypothetical protein